MLTLSVGFMPTSPIINSSHLNDAYVVPGENVTWICHARSDLETISQWFKFREKENGTTEMVPIDDAPNGVLTLTNVKRSDFGTYQCMVVNSLGHDVRNVSLHEDLKHTLPIINRNLAKQRNNFIVVIAVIITLSILIALYALRLSAKKKRITIIQAKQSFIIRKKVIIEQRDSDISQLCPLIKIEEERIRVDSKDQDTSKIMNQYQFQVDPHWEMPRTCLDLGDPIGEGCFWNSLQSRCVRIGSKCGQSRSCRKNVEEWILGK